MDRSNIIGRTVRIPLSTSLIVDHAVQNGHTILPKNGIVARVGEKTSKNKDDENHFVQIRMLGVKNKNKFYFLRGDLQTWVTNEDYETAEDGPTIQYELQEEAQKGKGKEKEKEKEKEKATETVTDGDLEKAALKQQIFELEKSSIAAALAHKNQLEIAARKRMEAEQKLKDLNNDKLAFVVSVADVKAATDAKLVADANANAAKLVADAKAAAQPNLVADAKAAADAKLVADAKLPMLSWLPMPKPLPMLNWLPMPKPLPMLNWLPMPMLRKKRKRNKKKKKKKPVVLHYDFCPNLILQVLILIICVMSCLVWHASKGRQNSFYLRT